jgi:hypothetical protein
MYRRLSSELASAALRSGRVGMELELWGVEAHSLAYDAASRCRRAADHVWELATDAYL